MSPSFSLSSLPDEVALSCMALLPRSDHASLSRVSKSYRSLVASPHLYDIRSQLGYSCFYVCLSLHGRYSTPRWFIISREKTVNRLMTPIPPCPSSHPTEGFAVVSLNCRIYVIGGSVFHSSSSGYTSSHVLLLDCRTHTWHQVTSMNVARRRAAAGVVNGKIYVFGGCSRIETFGENVLYSCDDNGNVFWREPEDSKWKKVNGLCPLYYYLNEPFVSSTCDTPSCDEFFWGYNKLRTFGTNILIFLFKYNPKNTKVDIWCTEISFERRHDKGEIVCEIEWLQTVGGAEGHPSSHVEVLHSAYVNV